MKQSSQEENPGVLTDLSPTPIPNQSATVTAASDTALVNTFGHNHDHPSTDSIPSNSAVASMLVGLSDHELVLPSVNANTSILRLTSSEENGT